MELCNIAKILGGPKVIPKKIQNRIDLIELSNTGITKNALFHLAKYMRLSMTQIAELLPITERTIQRYAPDKHFNRVVSEQILQIAEVVAKGVEVFEDRDKFISWMTQPNAALSNRTSISLLSSRFGMEMVLDELGRIEHGIFS